MNSLTVNLHLMLRSFYRPTPERHRIVFEADVFPSDRYALMNSARAHGFDPDEAVVILAPRPGERHLRTEDVTGCSTREGETVAVVVLSAVDFRTGALLDIPAITAAAHRAGALVGWDLAHAAGNVPLRLHDWDVDFAVWCHYKYLNSGPGAVGGCFVHERHGADLALVRPGGWWGHDRVVALRHAVRVPTRSPAPRAGRCRTRRSSPWRRSGCRWSCSTAVGMPALRARSMRLTGFLEQLLDAVAARRPLEVVTPRDPDAPRRAAERGRSTTRSRVTEALFDEHRVRCDDRPPNVIRIAPAPLYNTYHDCWRAAVALDRVLGP